MKCLKDNLFCNICQKKLDHKFQLYPLREIYQTNGIKEVCEQCLRKINIKLERLQKDCWNEKITVGEIRSGILAEVVRLKGLNKET